MNSSGNSILLGVLIRVAETLNRDAIPYMVIGGQAVLLYGVPRLTRDIDIMLGVNVDKLDAVMESLRKVGIDFLPSDPTSFVAETMVLPCIDEETGIRMDVIFSFSIVERTAISRCHVMELDSIPVSFMSAEDLVIHKIVSGRPRDEEDVRGILLHNPALDLEYIKRWLGEFEQSLDSPFVERFETLYTQ